MSGRKTFTLGFTETVAVLSLGSVSRVPDETVTVLVNSPIAVGRAKTRTVQTLPTGSGPVSLQLTWLGVSWVHVSTSAGSFATPVMMGADNVSVSMIEKAGSPAAGSPAVLVTRMV